MLVKQLARFFFLHRLEFLVFQFTLFILQLGNGAVNFAALLADFVALATIKNVRQRFAYQDEILSFANSRESTLGKPASSTPAISWFGNSLGQVKLGSDQMSLQAERAGVAAARVKYAAQAQSWGIKAPKTSGGSSNFAITVFILGANNES